MKIEGERPPQNSTVVEIMKTGGIDGLLGLLRDRLTTEEFGALEMPSASFESEKWVYTGNRLNMASGIFRFLEGLVEEGIIGLNMPEVEIEVSSDAEQEEALLSISKSSGKKRFIALSDYIESLLTKIALKLSRSGIDKVVEVIKNVVVFDKKQLADSGNTFVDHGDNEDRIFKDIAYLEKLNETL